MISPFPSLRIFTNEQVVIIFSLTSESWPLLAYRIHGRRCSLYICSGYSYHNKIQHVFGWVEDRVYTAPYSVKIIYIPTVQLLSSV
jgi:hypothetical protein